LLHLSCPPLVHCTTLDLARIFVVCFIHVSIFNETFLCLTDQMYLYCWLSLFHCIRFGCTFIQRVSEVRSVYDKQFCFVYSFILLHVFFSMPSFALKGKCWQMLHRHKINIAHTISS
jgi:hypothetical protein